ncbi:MAG: carboxypeptidase-like regulatory domain-containing protein, partial [Acidimicrobiia bacterium]|nr:carboxypeptidase-like regulatory domain-containing protein [Acidimicrobiia bacterium]
LGHGPLADGSPARATTNVDGGFGIDGLTLGTYTVRISGPPDPLFEPVTRTVRLGSNTVVSIDVTLQPFGSLIGHVTDPAGAPLEDVDVAVVGLAIGTLSEADGSFAIRAQLSTGSFQATFTKPGFVSTHADFTATVGRTTEITVVMDRNPALRGTITRPTASVATPFAPLGGMDVTAQLLDRNLAPVGAPLVRRSDATTGAYAFDPTELVPGTYQVTAADPASAFLGAGAQLVLARNQDQVLDLALSPRTEVTGRVRYRDNAGAANDVSAATVTGQRLIVGYEPAVGGAQPAPIFVDQASTTTNSTGDWTLDQQVAGTSPYLVTKAGFADATVDVTVDPAAAPAPVETFLTPRPGSISGTITVESSSPPSDRSGFEVTLTVPGTAIAAQHATTAADGSFSFGGLAPGRYALAVARSGFLPEPTPALVRLGTAPDPAATPGEITLAVAEAVRLEPISLRQLAHIRAGAVDATTAAALEGVSVQLDRVAANGATTTLGTRTTSAATPVVVFADLQPGNYRLTFSLADYPTVTVDTTITSFGDASDHSATPMLRFGRITGTVAGSTAGVDAPLVGAKVDAVRSGTVLATTTSSAGGAFTLAGLAAGDYEVRVSVGGFTQDATPAVAGLALGEVRTIGPVHLTAQLGGVEGRVVTDNQAGLQLIGVAVTLGGATSNGLPLAPDPAPVYATVADAQNGDGYFRFDDLDMGTVTLDFVAADHRPLRISVAVQRGQVLDLGQIVLQGDAGGITGTVTWKPAGLASTQGPVPSASVVLMHVVDGRREEIERKSTDANGRFAFSALTNQAYTLSVFGPLDPTDFRAARDLPVVVSGGLVTTRDVTLDAVNRRLTVTVTDRAGAAVVGAQVRLENGPAPAGPSATGAGGTVSFTVPPYLGPTAAGDPAQYSLRVTHADHLDGGGSFAFPPGADLARSVVLDRLARLGGRVLSDPAGSALTSL